jgi:ribosomal protein S18 acetylase RimI-like enzyme
MRDVPPMDITLELATADDAAAITAVRIGAARDLAAKFGHGFWSGASDTIDGVRFEVASGEVFLARQGGSVVATLRLSRRNPWLVDTSFFTAAARPAYLTSMAVAPKWQRSGIGRACLEACAAVLPECDIIRLDSFDAPAGAVGFYKKCGFVAVHRGEYLGSRLVWLERPVARKDSVQNARNHRLENAHG